MLSRRLRTLGETPGSVARGGVVREAARGESASGGFASPRLCVPVGVPGRASSPTPRLAAVSARAGRRRDRWLENDAAAPVRCCMDEKHVHVRFNPSPVGACWVQTLERNEESRYSQCVIV